MRIAPLFILFFPYIPSSDMEFHTGVLISAMVGFVETYTENVPVFPLLILPYFTVVLSAIPLYKTHVQMV